MWVANENALSQGGKAKYKSFGMEFARNNPVPVVTEAEKIKSEKAEDLAAAYKDDPEALGARKKDVESVFDEATGDFASYFEGEKYKYAKEEVR